MNIGDKVRMIHYREEGLISGFKGKLVIVTLESDLTVDVDPKELVVVRREEKKVFGSIKADAGLAGRANAVKAPLATRGIYLAFVPFTHLEVALHLINNTDYDLVFTLNLEKKNVCTGLKAGIVTARNDVRCQQLFLEDLSQMPVYDIRFLYFMEGDYPPLLGRHYRLRFRPSGFKQAYAKAPILEKDAHIYQIDKDEQPAIDPDKIVECMLEKPEQNLKALQPKPKIVPREVDLHIEKLVSNPAQLKPHEMLAIQIQHFERSLDAASQCNHPDITFIHGIGNGILKAEIHKLLGKHELVSYYKEGEKEKFGAGATKVIFK